MVKRYENYGRKVSLIIKKNWKIWKKGKLNSGNIWKKLNKGKWNSEKI